MMRRTRQKMPAALLLVLLAVSSCGAERPPPEPEQVYPALASWLVQNGGMDHLPERPVFIVLDAPDVERDRWWCEDSADSPGCGDYSEFGSVPFSAATRDGIAAALEPLGEVRYHDKKKEIFEMVGNAQAGIEGTVPGGVSVIFGSAFAEGDDLVLTVGCGGCDDFNATMVRMSPGADGWAVAEQYWTAIA